MSAQNPSTSASAQQNAPTSEEEVLRCTVTREHAPVGCIIMHTLLDESVASKALGTSTDLHSAWNMAAGDWASQSRVLLRADWKCSLENGLWTMIPTAKVLSTLLQRLLVLRSRGLNSTWEAVFPKKEHYTYNFVPLALEGTVITRQPFTSGPNHPSTAPNIYLPPYSNFPELTCGAHPYIVILAALQHMRQHEQTLTAEQLQSYSTMEHIRSLWIQLAPNHIDDSVLPPLEEPRHKTAEPNGSTQPRVKRARTSSPS